MVPVPMLVGVNVRVHVAVSAVVPALRVHVVNAPVAPLIAKVSIPVGVLVGPGDVSVTITVQALPWPITTGDVHDIAVLVARNVTVIVVVPPLPLWLVSPP